mgnify:FL=1
MSIREQLSLFDEAYEKGKPLISDTEYEKLYANLQRLEEKEGATPDSPTQTIHFSKVDGLETVKHSTPILSLDKIHDYHNLRKWYSQTRDEILVQPKLDGLTIVLRYQNGELTDAITRGNGLEGENVLHTISTVKNLPKRISFKDYLEVRGEVYIPFTEFKRINNGEYSNPRALTAGTVRMLDASLASKRGLEVQVFDVLKAEGKEFATDVEQLEFLMSLGLPMVETTIAKNFDYLASVCVRYQNEIRSTLLYPIDGLVLKANTLVRREVLGSTSKAPRWGISFKFASEEEFTILREIIWQVGKTGQITPVAIFDPIEIGGVTINRATLHNRQFIIDQDIRLSDRLVISRANDVIPKVVRSLPEARETDLSRIVLPETCPECIAPIFRDGPLDFCTGTNCPGQEKEKIVHFCSREAMDIDGLGKTTVETLYNLGFIRNVADLFTLKDQASSIEQLDGFGTTSVKKILKGIEKAKDLPLSRVLYSLSIPGIGRTTSVPIAQKFSMAELREATIEDLTKINGIGQIIATDIVQWFSTEKNCDLIGNGLFGAGLNFDREVVEQTDTLVGMTFVITGTLSKPRAEIEANIKALGGKISGSVSTKTSYLVAAPGETGTTKYQKALKLGVPIISESDVNAMLKGGVSA